MLSKILDTIEPAAILSEGIAAFCAVFFYSKYGGKWMILIPIILGCIIFTEVFSMFYVIPNNSLLYNILAIVTFVFYMLTYYKVLIKSGHKKFLLVGLGIYFIAIIANSLHANFLHETQLYSYSVGAILLIISILFYFVQLLNSPNILQVKYDLLFWLGIGNLLFYAGYLPIKFARMFHANIEVSFGILLMTHLVLIIVMNICFTLGFIWARKKKSF